MDDEKTIYTPDGTPIYWLERDVYSFIDKTTLIFGGSQSGKTTIIEEILYFCKDYIPNYIVIAPKTSDHVYRKKLPSVCIKDDLSKEVLEKIWRRQYYLTQIYNTANDNENLKRLFNKAPDPKICIMIKSIIQSADKHISEITQNNHLNYAQKRSQITHIEDLRNKNLKRLYKQSIRQNRSTLEKYDLDDQLRTVLEYLDFNPRLMLIIDDCSEKFPVWMKYYKKNETNPFNSIFYRGRWNHITLVFAAHDDKVVPPELRKNALMVFFTTSNALIASLNKTQSGYNAQEKQYATKISTTVFSNNANVRTHQKLCYKRELNPPFRYIIANLYPEFKIGCIPLQELADKIPKNEITLQDNPYVQMAKNNKNRRSTKTISISHPRKTKFD